MGSGRFVVVGGGIVGLATARELARRRPDSRVTVVEREEAVACHQTGRNSGVVHAGLYYRPDSLKAELCRRGRAKLADFCRTVGLPYEEIGKLVVATNTGELPALGVIEERARANGVPELRRLGADEIGGIEPHATGVAALHSPHTAITDFNAVSRAIARELDVRLGFAVVSIAYRSDGVRLTSAAGDAVEADLAVLCGGLQSDVLAAMAGDRAAGPATAAFRGEYWRLVPARRHLVRGLVYPVPDPRYPFLGVHFTPRVNGEVDLGPNAVLALGRPGYEAAPPLLPGMWRAARRPAVRAVARRHWRTGVHELVGSLSKEVFVRRAARLVPDITAADVVAAPSGVRAQAVESDGTLIDDFRISRCGPSGRVVAVRNAPSPGATSALAIAEHICDELGVGPRA